MSNISILQSHHIVAQVDFNDAVRARVRCVRARACDSAPGGRGWPAVKAVAAAGDQRGGVSACGWRCVGRRSAHRSTLQAERAKMRSLFLDRQMLNAEITSLMRTADAPVHNGAAAASFAIRGAVERALFNRRNALLVAVQLQVRICRRRPAARGCSGRGRPRQSSRPPHG